MQAVALEAGSDLAYLASSYARHLRAEGKSPRTVANYLEAIRMLDAFLEAENMPRTAAGVSREHVELFLADLLSRFKATSAHNRFRALATFWRWLEAEGEVKVSPMARMKPPALPEVPVPVLSEAELKRLLGTCSAGKDFEDLRDFAIFRFFIDSGCRMGELAGLRVGDLDLDEGVAIVTGKGNRTRPVALGPKTVRALDKYLRARLRRPISEGWLWIGLKGKMTDSGIGQMVRRRGAQIGIPTLHAHQLRHTATARWLGAGGNEGDVMRLHGWRSRAMLERYGAAVATDRALNAHRRMALNEDL